MKEIEYQLITDYFYMTVWVVENKVIKAPPGLQKYIDGPWLGLLLDIVALKGSSCKLSEREIGTYPPS